VRLKEAAPRLANFKIQAFRQPKNLDFRFKAGDHELGAEDFWFKHEKAGDKYDLEVYIKGLTKENHDQLGSIAFLLLDAAIGEYNVVTRIGGIEFLGLPEDPKEKKLLPLKELSKIVMGGG
jgi:hypothetical protein